MKLSHALFGTTKNTSGKVVYILGLPAYRRVNFEGGKAFYSFGIQLFKRIKTPKTTRYTLLGIPVYSKKKRGARTIRRILFVRWSKFNWNLHVESLQKKHITQILSFERSIEQLSSSIASLKGELESMHKVQCDNSVELINQIKQISPSIASLKGELENMHKVQCDNSVEFVNQIKQISPSIASLKGELESMHKVQCDNSVEFVNQIKQISPSIASLKGELENMHKVQCDNSVEVVNQIKQISPSIASLKGELENMHKVQCDNSVEFKNELSAVRKEQKDVLNRAAGGQRSAAEAVWALIFNSVSSDSDWLIKKNFSAGRWAVGYPALYIMFRVLNEARPKRILELGLGQSTRMIGQYVAAHEDVEHIVVEHDPSWIEFCRNDFALTERSQMLQCDRIMEPYKEANEVRVFEGLPEKLAGKKFDFIVIDAPLGGDMKHYSRIDTLKMLPGCLEPRFVILFDDTNRPAEAATVKEMKSKLKENNIDFASGEYRGDKISTILCSSDIGFFTSL